MQTNTVTKTQETTEQGAALALVMSGIDRVAVAAAMGKKDDVDTIKRKIPAGVYVGSLDLHIDYTLEKDTDYEVAPTVDLLSKAILCKALVMSGIQADNFFNALYQAALDAYTKKDNVGDVVTEADSRVLAKIKELQDKVTSQLPKAKRSGKTQVYAQITLPQPHA
jgi:DNA-binding NarL/FixJ family response regulator